MHLLLVGISHRTAPVELRERVDFQARGVDRGAAARWPTRGSTREAVVLSTCNRAELYVACDDVDARARGPRARSSASSTASTPPSVAPHVYDVADLDAARHLFRVAAGLDSLVVGEPQILGQVKEAHTVATDAADGRARAQPPVPLVVRRRQARAHRDRPRLGRRVGQLRRGRARARRSSATSRAATVVVIGAGEMGKLTALHMKSQGVAAHHDRQPDDGARGADGGGDRRRERGAVGRAGRRARRERHRHHRDRRGRRPILTKAHIEAVMRPRRNRPLFIIDIALPRDVEAAAGEIEQVFLYNIDDLQATVRENLARRAERGRRAPRRSSARRSTSSAPGSARAARSRPSWRCGSGSRRSGAPSSSGSISSCRRCRPRRARASTKSRISSSRSCC